MVNLRSDLGRKRPSSVDGKRCHKHASTIVFLQVFGTEMSPHSRHLNQVIAENISEGIATFENKVTDLKYHLPTDIMYIQ